MPIHTLCPHPLRGDALGPPSAYPPPVPRSQSPPLLTPLSPPHPLPSEEAEEEPEGYIPLTYGLAMTQGPRDAMEDAGIVIPSARYGYLYAAIFDGHQGFGAASFLKARAGWGGMGEGPPSPAISAPPPDGAASFGSSR